MLKPTIAAKIAGGVFAAIIVTGGGVAIATSSSRVSTAAHTPPQGEQGQAHQGGGLQGNHCGEDNHGPVSGSPSPRPSGKDDQRDPASPSPRPSGKPDCNDDDNCIHAMTPSPHPQSSQAGQRGEQGKPGEKCQQPRKWEPGKGSEQDQHGGPGSGPGQPGDYPAGR